MLTTRRLARALLPLLLVGLTRCDEQPRPWSAPPDGTLRDESEPFLPARDGVPLLGDASVDGSAAPEEEPAAPSRAGGLWASCHRDFRPSTTPAADVTRVGLLCGPPNGMRRVGETREGEVAPDGAPGRHPMRARKGSCYRIFAVAEASVRDLDVTVLSSRSSRLATDDTDHRWPILEAERPFCTFADDAFTIEVRSSSGEGRYALQVWELPSR